MAKVLQSMTVRIIKKAGNYVASAFIQKVSSEDSTLVSGYEKIMTLSGANQDKAEELFDAIEAQVKSEDGLE